MTMEALFGKLLAYEHELTQQSYVEGTKKKRKGIVLKVNSSREEYQDSSINEEDAEKFNLMVRRFGKFLRKSKDRKFSKSFKKVDNNNNNNYTCFECGKQGHIKFECPIYLRKHVGEKKKKTDRKQKKAYIAWEDSASITFDSSSDEEIANVCLMAKSMNDSSTSEEIEVNPDFEELLEAFNEMHKEAQRLVVLNKKLKSELKIHGSINWLQHKIS